MYQEAIMHFHISILSQLGASALAAHASASVHSVYRKTINLSLGTSLLSLQAAGTVLSPISLITSLTGQEMEMLPVRTGDLVSISGQTLEIHTKAIGSILFHFNPEVCQIRDLSFAPKPDKTRLSGLVLMMQAALEAPAAGGFGVLFSSVPETEDQPVLSAAKCRLREASEAWKESRWAEAAKALCALIGLGPGLTPSGDDFLCGIFAGLLLAQLENHPFAAALHREVLLHMQNTNDISQAFLSCALSGQFSEPVKCLPQAKTSGQILEAFRRIGHSSGMDTLAGIYYFLTHTDLFQK